MQAAEDKRRLRERARAARQGLPLAEREALSRAACDRVVELAAVASLPAGAVVLGYAASPEELDPAVALARLSARGVRVAYPRVSGPDALTLHACGPEELEPGPFGIRQPCESSATVDRDGISLVIVPGIAFDLRGHRIGYGGGYYDRLLPALRLATSVGVAFDGQIVGEVPAQEHDARVQWVVTPTRTVRAR